jgi:hypothetical protein
MHRENSTWGAPRIHGELLKLGIAIAQSTVSKYLPRHRKPPSQGWRTFVRNHLREAIAIDFAGVPTVAFRLLFVFVVLSLERRRGLHIMDHVIVLDERHLGQILSNYRRYYNRSRMHLALEKDAPEPRAVHERELGEVVAFPEVGGLHHRYECRAA